MNANTKLSFSKISFLFVFSNLIFPQTTSLTDHPEAFILNTEVAQRQGADKIVVGNTGAKGTWTEILHTAPGLLPPGSYRLRFRCQFQTQAPEAYLVVAVRPQGLGDGSRDAVRSVAWHTAVGFNQWLDGRFNFEITRADEDYAILFSAKNKVDLQIENLRVEKGPSTTAVPATTTRKPPVPLVLPTPPGPPAFDVLLPAPPQKTLSVADFGTSPELENNSEAFRRAVDGARELGGPLRLVVPRGIYHFTDDRPLSFEGLTDFEFDGNGSEFIFWKKKGELISVKRGNRILLRNMVVDWDWEKEPLAARVHVVSVESKGDYLDLDFPNGQKLPGPDAKIRSLEELNPATGVVGFEGSLMAPNLQWRGHEELRREVVAPQTLRLFAMNSDQRLFYREKIRAGQAYRMRFFNYQMNGFMLQDNSHLTLKNVDLYSAPGQGFHSRGDQHHTQLLDCRILPRPGAGRVLSTAADGLHVLYSKGYWKLENCDFSFCGDDLVNIHDNVAFAPWSDSRSLVLRASRVPIAAGDPIFIRNWDYRPTAFRAPVKTIEKISDQETRLVFEADLPSSGRGGMVVINERYDSGNIIIRNSYFHENSSRGLLISSPNVLIESNRFFWHESAALSFESGHTASTWSEGTGVSNVVVRGNSFHSAPTRGRPESIHEEEGAMIYVGAYLGFQFTPQFKTPFPIFRDLLFENNQFSNSTGVNLFLSSAAQVMVRGNQFDNPTPRPMALPYRGQVSLSFASNISLKDNTWGPQTPGLPLGFRLENETTGNLEIVGNAQK